MLLEILAILGLTIVQNASFTLVSRARNSDSIMFHALAGVVSNSIWLLVIRQVMLNINTWYFGVAYVIGAVIGSIIIHYISMKYFENKKNKNK